jgi:hypothetical protein
VVRARTSSTAGRGRTGRSSRSPPGFAPREMLRGRCRRRTSTLCVASMRLGHATICRASPSLRHGDRVRQSARRGRAGNPTRPGSFSAGGRDGLRRMGNLADRAGAVHVRRGPGGRGAALPGTLADERGRSGGARVGAVDCSGWEGRALRVVSRARGRSKLPGLRSRRCRRRT